MWNLIQFLSADVNLLVWSSRPIWCCASLFVQSANGLCWPVRSYFIGFNASLQMFLGYRKIITISFYLWSTEMMRWTGTAAPTMQVCSFLVIYDIYLPTILLDCFCQVTYGEARARARGLHTHGFGLCVELLPPPPLRGGGEEASSCVCSLFVAGSTGRTDKRVERRSK